MKGIKTISLCEEALNPEKLLNIYDFHKELMTRFNLPQWTKVNCINCGVKIPETGIRSIKICLNARNFGDVAFEVFCENCLMLETMYYRQSCNKINDFIDILLGSKKPNGDPIKETNMYKMNYNNADDLRNQKIDEYMKDDEVDKEGE